MEESKKARQLWQEQVLAPFRDKLPERKTSFSTDSGIPIKDIYGPEDIETINYLREIGFPGQYPYTRGIYPNMYRGRVWTKRQLTGIGSAEEGNKRLRFLLDEGGTGFSIANDCYVGSGIEPDDPLLRDTLGRTGTVLASLVDYETYLAGVPIERLHTNLNGIFCAVVDLAMFLAVADKRGIPHSQLNGTIFNDPLEKFHAFYHPQSSFPPGPTLKIVNDIIVYCHQHMPRFYPLSVAGYHLKDVGANSIQEIAITLADAITYIDGAIAAGLPIDELAPKVSLFFGCKSDFFEEIAKFRAVRRMWAKLMKERYGAKKPESLRLKMSVKTSGIDLPAQEPENNLTRVAIQALASILGGCQSLVTTTFDEALGTPSARGSLLALRTQQILEHETGAADVVDPMGGSYYVEYLTREIEGRAWEYLKWIEKIGGVVRAIEAGLISRDLARSFQRHQEALAKKEKIIVGLNEYQTPEDSLNVIYRTDPQLKGVQKKIMEDYQRMKKERDGTKVKEALSYLREVLEKGKESVVPPTLAAAAAYATVAEIIGVYKEVYGEYHLATEATWVA